jgi:predicted adenylyl cyclase CyaB
MGRNIEIKARAVDFERLARLARALSDAGPTVLTQEDIFFATREGRLKLRVLADDLGELIYYVRRDGEGPKTSDYLIAPTTDPTSLKTVLEAALGVRGVVRKTRTLLLCGQTRIHLDEVEGLGRFIELEVVLEKDQSEAHGARVAEELMSKLEIEQDHLVRGAYMDLLEGKADG